MRRMLFALLVPFWLVAMVNAQVPKTLSYQGIITDDNGVPRPDGDYSFTFGLYAVASGGTPLWTEVQTLQVTNGLFSATLGSVTPIALPFDQQYWLGIRVGADPEVSPRVRLTSVAYSRTADSAALAGKVPDASITAAKIASGQVVKSLNGLHDNVTLSAGNNVTITPSGNTLTIAASGSGGGLTLPYTGTLNSTSAGFKVTNAGAGYSVWGVATGGGTAGRFENNSDDSPAVLGYNNGDGDAVYGSILGNGNAVAGFSAGAGAAVEGRQVGSGTAGRFTIESPSSSGLALWVSSNGEGDAAFFTTTNTSGAYDAVSAQANGDGNGVWGLSLGDGSGVYGGNNVGASGNGVYGKTRGTGYGVLGESLTSAPALRGIGGTNGSGVVATSTANYGILAQSGSSFAGYFLGNVEVTQTLSKGAGSFKIDHPLDPANKYLYHSFVESPDMMNVYNGNVVLDARGEAVVELPAWFEALNRDFRYQLTPIGAPGPNLYVATKIGGNRFSIAGGTAGLEVSWQVTGIRHDAFADHHRIPVEEVKPPNEQGKYLHPVELGQPPSSGIVQGIMEKLNRTDDAATHSSRRSHAGAPRR